MDDIIIPAEKQPEVQAPEAKPKVVKKVKAEKKTPEADIEVSTEAKASVAPKKRVTRKKVEVNKQNVGVIQDYRQNLKLFNRWPTSVVEVKDIGLKPYINLSPIIAPFSAGRNTRKQFWKSKKSIVERLATKLMVPGHKGKKHYWTSGSNTGKTVTHFRVLLKTFDAIEKKTKKNPVEVLVRALEQGAPREGVAHIEYGGVRYPKAADMAPQRRIDLALRWMVQGAFVKSVKGKAHMWDSLAEEIIATSQGDAKSNCITKRTELERQAAASR
jgi:small subunit ribosomal protein S7